MSLIKKVVLITGASSGLGKSIKEKLPVDQFIVYGTSRNGIPPDGFQDPDNQLLELDVTDQGSVDACIELIIAKEKKIDILINNAGYAIYGKIANTNIRNIFEQFDTNFLGVCRVVKSVLPIMIEQDNGRILNIGSIAGRTYFPKKYFYSASKAALSTYSSALRFELRKYNIQTTLIEPGFIDTEFSSNTITVDEISRLERRNRIKKTGRRSAEQVADRINKIIKRRTLKPIYIVGYVAYIIAFITRFFPALLIEKLIIKIYKKHL